MPAHKGSPRYGGRKKGTPNKKTVDKAQDEALILDMVRSALEPMVRSQITAATGYKHLVARDKKGGKFKSITPEEVEKLNDPSMVAEIWEKHPSPEAFKHLLDRAYGRPAEKLQADVTHNIGPRMEMFLRGLKRAGNGNGGT